MALSGRLGIRIVSRVCSPQIGNTSAASVLNWRGIRHWR